MQSDAFFWRDHIGNEVDLLLEKKLSLVSVEIKSGETINADFFKGLEYFGNLGKIPKENRILIYGGSKNYKRTAAQVLNWKDFYAYRILNE